VVGSSLHVWTEGSTSTDKVAEYVDTSTPLSAVGEPTLNQTGTGTPPGFQLVVDFNRDGTAYGTLVGEPRAYGNDWWASNGTDSTVTAHAPVIGDGSGSSYHGTLAQWRTAFPNAVVKAFGFSLGSGALGDYTISSIDFAGTAYTFAGDVVLTSKDQCKDGGWATSHPQTFRNQGDCVSYFASSGSKGKN
jgi:hypothetical protein